MPGSMPATSQLDWLNSTTAMIVLFWSRATRDLLRSFGWGIAALHRYMQRRSCHPRRPPHSVSRSPTTVSSVVAPYARLAERDAKPEKLGGPGDRIAENAVLNMARRDIAPGWRDGGGPALSVGRARNVA